MRAALEAGAGASSVLNSNFSLLVPLLFSSLWSARFSTHYGGLAEGVLAALEVGGQGLRCRRPDVLLLPPPPPPPLLLLLLWGVF